ncbi:amino acid/amide ABC transporter substrate-binding protein, HAAT family (TC 3.A.1.4.-) [Proteiniborus ethanoligenes]|uniref:Amino acid/amide ABC transporter substrate-binding protein, HAAT family (TC 3.A.1.4.-) n=1 Tax=Proteiniborus ethanoligenes TaxID=415015 RepID=A0A1H3P2M1_9FIRM|nr:substrate-binding domain-containing protein [Proteiniborus ethanoligenes]SDY95055.1 amino acid/amide ABC transporter substrate-binding protein, HAAT family (TC 3.A.1.4.-) [Proteiniborus ethanoligenes]
MKRKVISLLLVIVIMSSLLLAGCGSKTTGGVDKSQPIRIGGITSLSGALQDYGQQNQRGFMLGLEYATKGTMEVAGRKIEVIWEDTTTVPDVARERAIKLLDQDKVDILVGPASSSDAAAILELAEEFKKVIVLEPAAADFLTGPSWNRYTFRTGRNSAQDANAVANVIVTGKPGAKVATLAPDSAYGRSMVEPAVNSLKNNGAELIHQEFPPAETTDFTPYILRIREARPDYLIVIWAGANNPWGQLMELNLEQYGIQITAGVAEIAALKMMQPMIGMHGYTLYYNSVPQNPVNDWLVEKHKEKYGQVPDIFVSGGMASAIAIVTALEKTGGNADAEELIKTMRGMEFDSPTGKRYFREEDHQAIQVLYEIILTEVEGVDHPVPKLVREIPAEDIAPPITVPADAKR